MLYEFAFIPSGAADPLAGPECSCFFADKLDDILDARHFAQRDVIENRRFVKVAVRINKAGSDCKAVEIDNPGGFGSKLSNLLVGPNRGNFSVMDGQSPGNGILDVHGNDMTVEENKIGRLATRRSNAGKECCQDHGTQEGADSERTPTNRVHDFCPPPPLNIARKFTLNRQNVVKGCVTGGVE